MVIMSKIHTKLTRFYRIIVICFGVHFFMGHSVQLVLGSATATTKIPRLMCSMILTTKSHQELKWMQTAKPTTLICTL